MTNSEIVKVVLAQSEGKKIEYRMVGGVYEWEPMLYRNGPVWNFSTYEYRVAPELRKPREWWLSLDKFGNPHCTPQDTPHQGYVHVREVISE